MDVSDSGTLQGLQDRLEKKYYYIVHVTVHANISAENTPIFYMKDITGKSQTVKPQTFWEGALIEYPPLRQREPIVDGEDGPVGRFDICGGYGRFASRD